MVRGSGPGGAPLLNGELMHCDIETDDQGVVRQPLLRRNSQEGHHEMLVAHSSPDAIAGHCGCSSMAADGGARPESA
ncbi:hypothetical protein SDC9_177349 [bioreactor metagenome]|uniref:Uncharacterized protein n=1 Tax=bioreactor metagenome TaxID=1076179 RepID=A0A645GT16_9ZZZZ